MIPDPPNTRLTLLSRDPATASPSLLVDAAGRVLARQALSPHAPAAAASGVRDVVAVPGEAVHVLWLPLQAHTPAQALAAARLLLEEHLGSAREDLHVALGAAGDVSLAAGPLAAGPLAAKPLAAGPLSAALPAAGPRLLAVVDEATLRQWRLRCAQLGLAPEVMLPDCLLLEEAEGDGLQAARFEGLLAVRGKGLAFTAEPELATMIAGPRPLATLDEAQAEAQLAAAAVRAGSAQPVNLLQHGHAEPAGTPARRWRRAALLAALVLAAPVLLAAFDTARLLVTARVASARADLLAASQVPELAGAADPSTALRALRLQRAAPETLAAQSAALFNALQAIPGAHLDSYEFDPVQGVRAGIVHPRAEDMEAMRTAMAGAGLVAVPLDTQQVAGGTRSLVAVEAQP